MENIICDGFRLLKDIIRLIFLLKELYYVKGDKNGKVTDNYTPSGMAEDLWDDKS